MLKKCLKTVLCIGILLSLCLIAINAVAFCEEQTEVCVCDAVASQNDEAMEGVFEPNRPVSAVASFHGIQRISAERLSLSRKNLLWLPCCIVPQPDVRCEHIFNRICAKLNEIEFQRILKQNE